VIVVDSSFLIARKNARDAHHARALLAEPQVLDMAPLLLHEYVLAETVNVLLGRVGLAIAVEAGRELLDAADVEFVPASPRFVQAWDAFAAQRAGSMSLTDAALVALARDRGVGHIATFDAEFRKSRGLRVVPSEA
jgi:predicted nucleic acid-binding protein